MARQRPSVPTRSVPTQMNIATAVCEDSRMPTSRPSACFMEMLMPCGLLAAMRASETIPILSQPVLPLPSPSLRASGKSSRWARTDAPNKTMAMNKFTQVVIRELRKVSARGCCTTQPERALLATWFNPDSFLRCAEPCTDPLWLRDFPSKRRLVQHRSKMTKRPSQGEVDMSAGRTEFVNAWPPWATIGLLWPHLPRLGNPLRRN